MTASRIAAYANCDDAYVVWRYDEPTPGCRGFALYRRLKGGAEPPVNTFTPFAGQTKQEGEHRPSTEWPIQRFSWTDVLARKGEVVQYRVAPIVRDSDDAPLRAADELSTDWTPELAITAKASDELYAFFNRGVLATQ